MRPFSRPLHFLLPFVSSIDQGIDMRLRNLTRKGLVRFLAFVVIDKISSIVSKILMQALELRPLLFICDVISDESNFSERLFSVAMPVKVPGDGPLSRQL